MASPRREKIPLLKINMKEVQRMQSLKRERKMKKRLKLYILRKGQSIKKEIMSPPHNNQECDVINNDVVNDAQVINNTPAKPIETDNSITCSEPVNLNSNNLLEKYGIKNCSVLMDKIPEKSPPKKLPYTETSQPQKNPVNSPILIKMLTEKKSQTSKSTSQVLKKKILQEAAPSVTQITNDNIPSSSKNLQKVQIPKKVEKVQVDSENPLKSQTPPMVSIPTELVFPLFQKNNEILLSADSTMRKLRPWLKSSDHQKQLNFCKEMLTNEYCLASLYKCMASSCGFYTNSSFLFHQHMRLHWENQREDAKNFCQCPYCNFKNENSYLALINHITDDHGYCR